MNAKIVISRLIQQRRFAKAKQICQKLTHDQPGSADAWRLMAKIASDTGDEDAEIHSLKEIVSIYPTRGLSHFNLAMCLDKAGHHQEAEPHYRKALELDYQPAHVLSSLGFLLHKLHRSEEGIECCRKAVKKNKYLIEAWTCLGQIHAETYQPELALECLLTAKDLAIKSDHIHYNLGLVYSALLRSDDAIDSFRIALKRNPDFVDARWNLSLELLRCGRFTEGWELYETRWQRGGKNLEPRDYKKPMWDGSDLKGKSIYLFAEQGFGDSLQFIRYARLIKSLGARVIFECQPQLKSLLELMTDIDVLVTSGTKAPSFDTYSPLLSLPRIMGTTIETIPSFPSYLTAPSELDDELDGVLYPFYKKLKVGIVWAGNPNHTNDLNRSFSEQYFYQLGKFTNVQLFSLQKHKDSKQSISVTLQDEIVDLSSHLCDFAVTAAIINRLDLVITVDTAIAHLAGALGKKTWVLLPFSPDWRWKTQGKTSAWYPSLRLFRQPRAGNWQAVFDRVAEELQAL